MLQKKQLETKPSIDEQLQLKKVVDGFSTEKQSQHCKLMDEFKKAHKRMFKSADQCDDDYEDCIVVSIFRNEFYFIYVTYQVIENEGVS